MGSHHGHSLIPLHLVHVHDPQVDFERLKDWVQAIHENVDKFVIGHGTLEESQLSLSLLDVGDVGLKV